MIERPNGRLHGVLPFSRELAGLVARRCWRAALIASRLFARMVASVSIQKLPRVLDQAVAVELEERDQHVTIGDQRFPNRGRICLYTYLPARSPGPY